MEHEQMTEEQESSTNYKAILYDWGKTIALSIIIALFVRLTMIGAYYVPTGSMRPTIGVGDRLIGWKFLYRLREPHIGEIVVFKPPQKAQADVPRFVKRVVAVAGDVVEVKAGALYVNGTRQDEPYASTPFYEMPPITVPTGQLFVLGDNRNNSADGHVWGFLPEENVEAKIVFRFWPLTRIGMVE